VVGCEEPAGAVHAGLHFVEDEQRAISRTELLRFAQIIAVRQPNAGFGLYWFHEKRRALVCRQLPFERGEVVERNGECVRQHRAELAAPEIVAHQRESAAGESVKRAVGVDQPGLAGGGARELDGAFDALASGAGEKRLAQPTAGESAQRFARSPARSGTWLCNIAGPWRASSFCNCSTIPGWLCPTLWTQ